MPAVPAELTDAVRAFLRRPTPAVTATVARNGRPVTVATWHLLEDDDRIMIDLEAERVRFGHLRRDPRLALDVLDGADRCTRVALQSSPTSMRCRSTPRVPRMRRRPSVSLRAEIRSVLTRGALRCAGAPPILPAAEPLSGS